MANSRERTGRIAGLVGIGVNGALFFAKLAVGTLAGSVSITADAMNNLSDTASSVVTLVGFKLVGKPADKDHPYGHARFEYLSGLAVAVMVLFIGLELAKSSIGKILSPTPVEFSWVTAAVLALAIGAKLFLALFYTRSGKKIRSDALLASAADSRNDCVTTAAVLLSGLIQTWYGWNIDGFMGLGVAVFILWSGYGLAKDTISPLLGEAAGPELREQILDQVRSAPLVLGYHDLMVHDYGPDRRFASIHVEMDRREDPLVCHEIIDGLERGCYERHGIHLVVHYDPVITDDPVQEQTRTLVQNTLAQIDPRLTVHDFRLFHREDHIHLFFDVALPEDLSGCQEIIRRDLEERLNTATGKPYRTTITFDPLAFNQ